MVWLSGLKATAPTGAWWSKVCKWSGSLVNPLRIAILASSWGISWNLSPKDFLITFCHQTCWLSCNSWTLYFDSSPNKVPRSYKSPLAITNSVSSAIRRAKDTLLLCWAICCSRKVQADTPIMKNEKIPKIWFRLWANFLAFCSCSNSLFFRSSSFLSKLFLNSRLASINS